jgi:7TM diverse intracellular signalling
VTKIPLLLILLFSSLAVFAQPVYTLTDSPKAAIKSYALLPDKGYSIEKIIQDSTLPFVVNDSLRPAQHYSYWIKIEVANPFHYAEAYNVWLRPYLNNTLYYFDANAQKWVTQQTGIMDVNHKGRNQSTMPCVFQGLEKNTIYIYTDVGLLSKYGYAIKPKIIIEKKAVADSTEQFIWIAWVASLSVVLLFFLNNLYIWYSFRDKTVFYYLIAQFGGIIYITAYREMFYLLFHSPVFTYTLLPNGFFYSYDVNNVLMHLSVLLILYGLVELTRSYLNTKKNLPRLDAMLKYGKYTYVAVTFILIFINTTLFYLDDFTLLYDNILYLLVTAVIIGTSIAGYMKKLPAAGPFLLALILPLVLMLSTALYHVLVSFTNTEKSLLPDFAIVSQAIIFSIALVARIKSIRYQLAAKELEATKLAFDIRELELKHQLVELENEKINTEMLAEKTRNELLQEKLEANQRELASTTLYIVQKNELLASLKTQIKELNKQYPNSKQPGLQSIESILQSNLYLDDDWSKFKLHFEQVHPNFFKDLQEKYPSLTKNEIRLHAYFHINLSTKEIAALLNIDPASVRRAKTRLYKKMAIAL